jgi:uncharacterized protein YjbI with pentapeptide repeats
MSLTERWASVEGARLVACVFERLLAGKTLADLQLSEFNGRLDLRGIKAPPKEHLDPFLFRDWVISRVKQPLQFRQVLFRGIDFSGADLSHVQFFDSQIENCSFESANCTNLRLWGTQVVESSFAGASLDGATLGAWINGRGNVYKHVLFCRASMAAVVSPAAAFEDCDFSFAKLYKIDFQSSSFIRCRFAGELREVIFYDHGFKTGKPSPNPMLDVDFRKATLRWVEFRRLNLDRVSLPLDENHIVVRHYRCALNQVFEKLNVRQEPYALGLRGIIKNRLKWIGPEQKTGIFCCLDFRELLGPEGENLALELLKSAELACNQAN